jgi:hypothetical protein
MAPSIANDGVKTMQHPMELEAAEAAKLVGRDVPELGEDGLPTGKMSRQPLEADEVLAVRVRDHVVTVVTVAGERLTGEVPAARGARGAK